MEKLQQSWIAFNQNAKQSVTLTVGHFMWTTYYGDGTPQKVTYLQMLVQTAEQHWNYTLSLLHSYHTANKSHSYSIIKLFNRGAAQKYKSACLR